ncbi:MAG: nickel transporter, partial [Actinomycetota bacterium]|nr:nickel transporter [Actinomycetota bacterium]
RGLIGMGVAGGLVPSPSALVVLLGSVALGRTVFGVLLVFAYGFGMAATLTAVGLVLVRLRGRLDRFSSAGRADSAASKVVAALPIVTAALVLVVGLGLVARGLLFSP